MPKSFLHAAEIPSDSLRDAHLFPPCRAERPMNHAQVAQTRILLILEEYLFYLLFGGHLACLWTSERVQIDECIIERRNF